MKDIIFLRVCLIIAEMGLKWPVSLINDFDPRFCIKNYGPHRTYQFHLEIRDDVDTTDFAVEFCSGMAACNRASPVKADFRGLSEYPGPVKNWHTVYLTVETI